ncbi:MAG: tetraacyldisaccharide 4'-kinase [Terracidiphilus sp.]
MSTLSSARRLLLPLVPLYRLALGLRGFGLRGFGLRLGWSPVQRLHSPVISVGNLATGGAGKTPLILTLARALEGRGLRVDVLSRGYGRQSRRVACVPADGNAQEFGDEPLLIARETGLRVYVAPRRFDAGQRAEAEGNAGGDRRQLVHLLDDGFQHRQLARTVDIVLVSGRDWRDGLLPAGNLREPRAALRRADVLAVPAEEPEGQTLEKELRRWGWNGPVWRLRRVMDVPPVAGPVAAFCGIARPEQFFAGLEGAGIDILLRRTFPDHFPYSRTVLEDLAAEARQRPVAAILTTGKDRVRMGELASVFSASIPLKAVGLRVEIENQDAALDWLIERLKEPVS